MDDGHSYMSLILFVGMIMLDAAVYGFGAAIQSLNMAALEREVENENGKAQKLYRLVNHPGQFIHVNQIVTNLIGMATGAFVLMRVRGMATGVLKNFRLESEFWIYILTLVAAAIVLILLLISLGMVVPKRLAERSPEKWAYGLLPVISVISMFLAPFGWMVTGLSALILRLAGIRELRQEDNVTEEEIMSMVNEGHEQGILEANEAEMITNIFQLNDKEAGDIMTHRKDLVCLDSSMGLKEAVNFILTDGKNSRYPVYEEEVDNVIGLLYMKDALIFAGREDFGERTLAEIPGLLRDACFIPETRDISSLFQEMQSKKIHMEIVVDEYGQTVGVVTMEDILEEIVGNILDEYDVEEEEYISAMSDGSFFLGGMAPLEEVGEALHLAFDEEDLDSYDTINGFLISRLGRIPREDERDIQVSYGGYLFQILQMENKTIHSIRVFPQQEKTPGDPEETRKDEKK